MHLVEDASPILLEGEDEDMEVSFFCFPYQDMLVHEQQQRQNSTMRATFSKAIREVVDRLNINIKYVFDLVKQSSQFAETCKATSFQCTRNKGHFVGKDEMHFKKPGVPSGNCLKHKLERHTPKTVAKYNIKVQLQTKTSREQNSGRSNRMKRVRVRV